MRAADPALDRETRPEAAPLSRRRLVFGIVALALFMASVDQTIVATALSAIQRDLSAPVSWSAWTITVYALGQIIAMPVAGKLADEFGRKRVFLMSIALFTAASLACGLSTNIYLLVSLRAVQALGGGAFIPSATGIVADHFGPARDRAVGMFSSILPIGGIVGPVIGGAFVAHWSWRGIFLVNVPPGIALVLLGSRFIEPAAPSGSRRIDLRGIALLGGLLLAAMFGVTMLADHGRPLDPGFLVPEGLALVAATMFVRHAARDPAAVVPIAMLRGRAFGVMNLLNLLLGSVALGVGALVPLYAEQRYGIDPVGGGTLLTARALGMICLSGLSVLALRRFGHRVPMAAGFAFLAGGLALMAMAPRGMSPYTWLAVSSAVTGIGMGMAVPAANNASLHLAPQNVAAIAGLRGMFRQTGSIVAVSGIAAILSRSRQPGLAQAHIQLVLACVLLLSIPVIFSIPEHRGQW